MFFVEKESAGSTWFKGVDTINKCDKSRIKTRPQHSRALDGSSVKISSEAESVNYGDLKEKSRSNTLTPKPP